jgi:hypothetical protein
VNVRAPCYVVASGSAECARCGRWTHVVAVALPCDHEVAGDDSDESGDGARTVHWQAAAIGALLFYIRDLPESVQRRIAALTSSFRLAVSAQTGDAYWMNHCEQCGAAVEDHDLHCEPGGAFMPMSAHAAAAIRLLQIFEPFQAAAGGYAFDGEFL